MSSETTGLHLTTEEEGQDHSDAEEDRTAKSPKKIETHPGISRDRRSTTRLGVEPIRSFSNKRRGKDERDLDLKNRSPPNPKSRLLLGPNLPTTSLKNQKKPRPRRREERGRRAAKGKTREGERRLLRRRHAPPVAGDIDTRACLREGGERLEEKSFSQFYLYNLFLYAYFYITRILI